MRSPLIRGFAGVVGMLLAWLVVLPMGVAAAETAKDVNNAEEAWFLAKRELLAESPTGEDPSCGLPTECNISGQAMRPSSHPENTLVVAALNGEPDAQMFFSFDLPFGAIVKDGTVTLPVAQDPEAGNQREDEAKMRACVATGFIPGGTDAGSWNDKPAVNDNVCTPVEKVNDDPLTYSFSLQRLGKVWTKDTTGVTVMVDPGQVSAPNPAETWRVVFNTVRRSEQKPQEQEEAGAEETFEYPAITSDIQYTIASTGFGPVVIDQPEDFGGGEDFSTTGQEDFGGGEDFAAGSAGDTGSGDFGTAAPADSGAIEPPADAQAGAPAVGEPVAAEGAEQPVAAGPAVPASAVGVSPAVWMMPLVALALAGAFAYSLTQPVELAGQRQGAVSKLMRTRRLSAAETPAP